MPEGADKQSKTFDPTPQRIKKAREEGNVFRSQETTAVGMLVVGVSVLAVGTPLGFAALKELMSMLFVDATSSQLTSSSIPAIVRNVGSRSALIIMPFLSILFLAAIAINVSQSGFNLTAKPLMPKGERVSPLKGLKRIFSAQGFFNFGKSVIKIVIVGPIAYWTIRDHMPEILVLHTQTLTDIIQTGTSWIVVLLFKLIGMLALLSAADFAFEKWRYKRDLKMSKQEIKDEMKDQDGDPQMKGKRREKAREYARRERLDHAVMKSDVVVTNPTHYAVALRYDPDDSDAPRVTVKGVRKRALRIKELAAEFEIPMVEDRPLARALYATVNERSEIPEELYPAVAALLAEIYRERDNSN
jgi:flagellar biosynthetic protein FlhB